VPHPEPESPLSSSDDSGDLNGSHALDHLFGAEGARFGGAVSSDDEAESDGPPGLEWAPGANVPGPAGSGLAPAGGGYLFACGGHRNQVTLKNVCWLGGGSGGEGGSGFVVSGSDDGSMFIWRGSDGRLANVLEGGDRPLNCVKAHPFNPLLASCGMDPVVRLWSPGSREPTDLSHSTGIIDGNAAAAAALARRGGIGAGGGLALDALLGQGLSMAMQLLSGMLGNQG
jgi:hypothetical protein